MSIHEILGFQKNTEKQIQSGSTGACNQGRYSYKFERRGLERAGERGSGGTQHTWIFDFSIETRVLWARIL